MGDGDVSARTAIRTPQSWLLWAVLCVNVTAGIGILERAAPIYSDFFASGAGQAAAAAGFVAILSLANMLGRFVWSSASDLLGVHGRLLTAWSTAGVLGPMIINAVADSRIAAGVTGPSRYTASFSIMLGLLVLGLLANELVRPLHPRFHEPVSGRTAPKVVAAG
jgi:hypothetical protein